MICAIVLRLPVMMDYMRKFDIELEREYYYAGERLKGWVVIENVENVKVRGQCHLNAYLLLVTMCECD